MIDVESVTGSMAVPPDAGDKSLSLKSVMQMPMNMSLPAAQEWVSQCRKNVRPWSLFLNTAKFRAPQSIPRLSRRLVKNIEHFQSNYLFVFIGLIIFCLLTSPLLLIAVAASLGACYVISLKQAERKLTLMGRELSLAQQYSLVAVCSIPVYYWAGAGAAVFWVLGASFFIITAHAAFFNIESVLNPDDEQFDLITQEV